MIRKSRNEKHIPQQDTKTQFTSMNCWNKTPFFIKVTRTLALSWSHNLYLPKLLWFQLIYVKIIIILNIYFKNYLLVIAVYKHGSRWNQRKIKLKRLTTLTIKYVKKLELSYIAAGSAKLHKQFTSKSSMYINPITKQF